MMQNQLKVRLENLITRKDGLLMGRNMEDLLVPQCESIREVEMCVCISSYKRLSEYWKRLYINKCA